MTCGLILNDFSFLNSFKCLFFCFFNIMFVFILMMFVFCFLCISFRVLLFRCFVIILFWFFGLLYLFCFFIICCCCCFDLSFARILRTLLCRRDLFMTRLRLDIYVVIGKYGCVAKSWLFCSIDIGRWF